MPATLIGGPRDGHSIGDIRWEPQSMYLVIPITLSEGLKWEQREKRPRILPRFPIAQAIYERTETGYVFRKALV
jgi:hypothetical protein